MKIDSAVYCIELNEIVFRDGKFLISEEGLKGLVLDYLEIQQDMARKSEDEGYFFKGKELYCSEIADDGSVINRKIQMIDKDRLLFESTRLFR